MSNAVATGWPSGSGNLGWGQEPSAMLMPGRVQGWPAGTQRAANRAETLLTQAVAYWDVAQYRDGDRFLRNRGTGGELLDLRLGSSIVANSNDPLFLPVADEGYVYLTGVAGNSLTVTAPATATNYIAYPLDRSASTATGAVTGGATFTFSTTGSWRLIELLDASDVVVDTIDCDVITSGSATSFASTGAATVTINRSTAGRKSVAVPSRSKNGAPVLIHGTDDFMEIPAEQTWQHGLLNFDNGQPFTVIAVIRQWDTPTNSGRIINKTADSVQGGNRGWTVRNNGATLGVRTSLIDDFAVLTPGNTVSTSGSLAMVGLVVDRSAQLAKSVYNAASFPSTSSTTALGSLVNTISLRVGRVASAAVYQDFDLYAIAIWRRALSGQELNGISAYFTGRIA